MHSAGALRVLSQHPRGHKRAYVCVHARARTPVRRETQAPAHACAQTRCHGCPCRLRLSETDLPKLPQEKYLQEYAATKDGSGPAVVSHRVGISSGAAVGVVVRGLCRLLQAFNRHRLLQRSSEG